jgi:hypothetical protein
MFSTLINNVQYTERLPFHAMGIGELAHQIVELIPLGLGLAIIHKSLMEIGNPLYAIHILGPPPVEGPLDIV